MSYTVGEEDVLHSSFTSHMDPSSAFPEQEMSESIRMEDRPRTGGRNGTAMTSSMEHSSVKGSYSGVAMMMNQQQHQQQQWDPHFITATDLEQDVKNVVMDFCEAYGDFPSLLTDDFGPFETPDPLARFGPTSSFPIMTSTFGGGGGGVGVVMAAEEEEQPPPRLQKFPQIVLDGANPRKSVELTESGFFKTR
jgi:hypothetical protein